MKRLDNLYATLISDNNLLTAIDEVNKSHRYGRHHKPNRTVEYIEYHKMETVKKLRQIIEQGYVQGEPQVMHRYDQSSMKWRNISVPKLYPDQYIHHALVQTLEPVMMRGMDRFCCGSIKGRGTHYGVKSISKWMHNDKRGTKYCMELDIRHFYENLSADIVMARFRCLVKDDRVLSLCENILKQGVPIGFYTSQWFANTVLQPLDMMIRQSGKASHYVRYMDNFTIFGGNKRKLHQLRKEIERWLNEHGLELKPNWQIFPTKSRYPNAMGYRFTKDKIILRKRNRLRMIRQISRYKKKVAEHRRVSFQMAAGLLSRLGQLRHCCHNRFYEKYLPVGMQKILKSIIRRQNEYQNAIRQTIRS